MGDRPPAPRRNFQAHWQYACEGQWRVAFLMISSGVPVFFCNMALAAWIKVPKAAAPAQQTCWHAGNSMAVDVGVCASPRERTPRLGWQQPLPPSTCPPAPLAPLPALCSLTTLSRPQPA